VHLELMRDERPEFPNLDEPGAVHSARIWHCKYRSLAALADLPNLETLVIASYPDDSLDVVGHLEKLRYLSVLHLPKVSDLKPLQGLQSLEALSLSTLPSWDTSRRRTRVRSVAPLASLAQLRHLELLGVVPEDDSLMSLANQDELLTVRLHGFAANEVAAFFSRSSAADAFAPDPVFDGQA
jgi:hypothetical protein